MSPAALITVLVIVVVGPLVLGALWNWWIGATPSEPEEHDP